MNFVLSSVLEERLDSLASGGDVTEPISDSAFIPPPDYATVMNEDTEIDTDDCVDKKTTPPWSSDSTCSNHSSHQLLPEGAENDS